MAGTSSGHRDIVDISQDDEDPELAAALAASLQDTHGGGSRNREQEDADAAATRLAMLDPGPEPPVGPGEGTGAASWLPWKVPGGSFC